MKELYEWLACNKEVLLRVIEVIAIIGIIVACYPKWCEIWYQFGGSIYTLIHH